MPNRHITITPPSCPLCRGDVHRTMRRPLDRFTSLFVLKYRYRCTTHLCEWEGNLRPTKPAGGSTYARSNWLSLAIPVGSFGVALVLIFMANSW